MLREDTSCSVDRRQPHSYHVCVSIRNSSYFRDDYGIAMEADCPSDKTLLERSGNLVLYGLSDFRFSSLDC
jgi:hypothetical protein